MMAANIDVHDDNVEGHTPIFARNNCRPNNLDLSIVSYNMHGYNQGSHTVRDLMISNNLDLSYLYSKSTGSNPLTSLDFMKIFHSTCALVIWFICYEFMC